MLSMMSTIPRANNNNAAGADSYTTERTQNRVGNESVILHQLCDRCKSFTASWTWLRRVQEGMGEYTHQLNCSLQLYPFATIAQLLQTRDICHMCAIVLSMLDYTRSDLDLPVEFAIGSAYVEKKFGYMHLLLHLGDYRVQWRSASLYLKTFNMSNDAFDGPEQRQSVPSQPTANLDQINTWLNTCIQTHKSCSRRFLGMTTSFQRPTRILELTSDGVRLLCDTSNIEDLRYLTLSHVWGDSSHRLRLTLSRLDDFQVAIPWSELPAIFVEALRIVRHTGFRYLWVDVLCIIQDSPLDWNNEAASMTSVYRNAICSIAFLFPPGRDLIQTREDPRTISPCILRRATQTSDGVYIVTSGTRCVPGSESGMRPEFTSRFNYNQWPISQRAWTFQEYLLSPRTVFCGHQTIMWECMEEFCDELAGSWLPNMETQFGNDSDRRITRKSHLSSSHADHTRDTPISFAEHEHLLNYFKDWKDLIQEYSARNLTVASDRPMAFAGVARAFRAEDRLGYLAGIWAESLPDGLLWYVKVDHDVEFGKEESVISQTIREPGSNKVPSWSWLACPLYLDHNISFFNDYQSYIPATGDPQPNDFRFLAQLEHFQWYGRPLNQIPPTAFHDFSGLRITLKVATYQETRLKGKHGWFVDCLSLKERLEFLCHAPLWAAIYCDDLKHYEQPPEETLLALLVETQDTRKTHSCFGGLALVPGGEKGTWKRFGLWRAKMYAQTNVKWVDAESSWENEDPTIGWKPGDGSTFLRLDGVKMESLTLV